MRARRGSYTPGKRGGAGVRPFAFVYTCPVVRRTGPVGIPPEGPKRCDKLDGESRLCWQHNRERRSTGRRFSLYLPLCSPRP